MFGWLMKLLGISKEQPAQARTAPASPVGPSGREPKAAVDPPQEKTAEPAAEADSRRISEEDGDFLKKLLTGGGHTDLQHFPPHERAFLALLMRKANSAELEIPMLPEAAVEIRKLMRNPDVNIARFAEVFRNDPSLTAEILKIANSPFYGFEIKTHDVGQAVTRVGYNQVRSVVMMFSVRSKVLHGGQYLAESELIADLALATARACGILAVELGLPENEAFARGLLSHLDFFIILGVAAEFNASHKEVRITREMIAEAVGRIGPVIMNLIEKKWRIENLGYGGSGEEAEESSLRGKVQTIGLSVVESWAGREPAPNIPGLPTEKLAGAVREALGAG